MSGNLWSGNLWKIVGFLFVILCVTLLLYYNNKPKLPIRVVINVPFNESVSDSTWNGKTLPIFGKCIPKIIHQTWKTNIEDQLPPFANKSVNAWKTTNPEFIHCLWNDTEAADLVRIHYSYLIPMYNDLDPVQKADLFRYLVLLKYGGVYGDVDTAPKQPINEWFNFINKKYEKYGKLIGENGSLVEIISAVESGQIGMRRRLLRLVRYPQITQWAMAGCAGHPVFRSAVDRLFFKWQIGGNPGFSGTLDFSGPGLFSDAINDFIDSTGVILLPECALGCVGDQSDTLVVHFFEGSWKKPGWGG